MQLAFSERGSGPPLLLIHGAMVTGRMFEPVIEPLAARHRVIVPDLRGHGGSRGFPPPYTVEQLAQDLSDLLEKLGIASAAVLGYSQGGAVAQQLALEHPQQCNRLILACTYAFNMSSFREKVEGHVLPLLIRALGMRRFAKLTVAQGLKSAPKELVRWVRNLMESQDAQVMISAWRGAMAFDSRKRLGEIKCPTLVIAGAEDRAVPMHHAKMLREAVVTSRLVVIEEADHGLIWAKAGQFVQIIMSFLGD
jgi:3-oxoadipate enol-lactonase